MCWIGDDDDVLVVFCCCSDECWSADVNVFDDVFDADVGLCDGVFKRVQVADHEVYGGDVVLFEGLTVLFVVSSGKNPCVDDGVQCFDSAIQHLWKTGEC